MTTPTIQKMKQFYKNNINKNIIDRNNNNNKKNNEENSDDNFWDIDLNDNDEISNNLELSSYDRIHKKINNSYKNNEEEKKRIKELYDKLNNRKTLKFDYKINITKKIKAFQPKEKKKMRPKSVDINMSMKEEKDISKRIKDDLSVYKRNQKWLQIKKNNLNKVREKIINKNEKEMKEYMKNKFKKKSLELDRYYIFNEENNVKYKPENINYFLRLNKLREEKLRTTTDKQSHKINFLKYSHYSGIKERNISQREMNKCIKYIHDKLKGKK
jgi:hypothetical protein